MAIDLPYSLRELIRNRQTCLCLSDSTGSFQWRFFSYRLLPQLRQKDEYGLKGAFKRGTLILIVPFSKLPKKESVVGLSYSRDYMNKLDIPCECNIYFVNTSYPALDNVCFAVYIDVTTDKDGAYVLEQLQKARFVDVKSIAFINDAFQMNSASFNSLIDGILKSQSSSPKLKLGYTIINLVGAQIGADSLDTPKIALAQSSTKMGYNAKMPTIEIDYNYGLGLEHISQIFSSNDDYARQLKDNLIKEIEDFKKNKIRNIDMKLESAQLFLLDSEWNVSITAKTISESIIEQKLERVIKLVSPQLLDTLEQMKLQKNVKENEFTRGWKSNLISQCDNTLKRLNNI